MDRKNGTTGTGGSPKSCGIVMPIGPLDGCSADHWSEVKAILTEAVESATDPKFAVKLVSEADDVGVIQKRIVQNVYNSDIIVCDVSGKNPNVMFELGMRLAFDKCAVLVKDDKTDYSFDTGIIEHLTYPRDLRFAKIVEFKSVLAKKVSATFEVAADKSPFLKNFGQFHVANLQETVVPAEKLLLESLEDLRIGMSGLQRKLDRLDRPDLSSRRRMREKLAEAVAAFADGGKPKDPRLLVGDDKFLRFAEEFCGAPKYFDSRDEFRMAVDRYLRDLAS